jgi:hypothetical protein
MTTIPELIQETEKGCNRQDICGGLNCGKRKDGLLCNDCGYTHNENGFCEFSNCRTKVILERDILDTFKQAEKIEENTIIIGDYEYETKTHDFNKCLKDIKIPKGWELWTVSDFEKFNLKEWDKLGLKDSWFFIKYPFAFNLNNCVAGFIAYSGRADWYCNRNSSYSNDGLGVRFRRKVKAVEE